jgi:hypothetical protein
MHAPLPSAGVIYSLTGERFLREAERSAASVRRHMPGLPIAIYTERTDADPALFDIIRPIAAPTFSVFDKQFGFREPLFEKSLFLDCDTFAVKPFPEIFDLLDRFDFAATREFWSGIKPSAPVCYDDFNGGVIAFANRTSTRRTLDRWFDLAKEMHSDPLIKHNDQDILRQATYEAPDLQVYVLPPQYNLRIPAINFLNVWADPVILHGHTTRFGEIAAQLNRTHEHRLLIPNIGAFGRLQIVFADKLAARVLQPPLQFLTTCISGIRNLIRRAH